MGPNYCSIPALEQSLLLSPSRGNLKSSLALLGTRLHGVYPEQNKEILPLRLTQGQNDKKRRIRDDTTWRKLIQDVNYSRIQRKVAKYIFALADKEGKILDYIYFEVGGPLEDWNIQLNHEKGIFINWLTSILRAMGRRSGMWKDGYRVEAILALARRVMPRA